MQSTEWRTIPGYEGFYEASASGMIRSIAVGRSRPPRVMKQQLDRNGYLSLDLHVNGVRTKRWVHRLVCAAFHGESEPGSDARHSNGIRTDNRAENLSWGTRSENMQDARRHGTLRNMNKTHCIRGHLFDEENTSYRKGGGRSCKACKREDTRRARANVRELAYALEQAEQGRSETA